MRKTLTVYVRNNGDKPFVDRYDGEDFTIAPGGAVEMDADCARLVFGFGEQDKSRAIRRLGWAPTSADMEHALRRLHSFSFFATKEECEAATAPTYKTVGEARAASKSASLSAPASGANAAGGGAPPPAAVSQAPGGTESRVIGQKDGGTDDVQVEPRKDERRPVNAMENIARVATTAAAG